MYNTMQFLHVASAVVWIGSGVGLLTLMGALRRAGDGVTLMGVTRQMEGLGTRLFAPAAMSTLVFGILAVITSDFGFQEPWIIIGLVGVALSLALVIGVATPASKRALAAVEAHGPEHPDVAASAKRARLTHTVNLVMLFVVVWAMVVKPGA